MASPTSLAALITFLYYGYLFVATRGHPTPSTPLEPEPDKKKYFGVMLQLQSDSVISVVEPFGRFIAPLEAPYRWDKTHEAIIQSDPCQDVPDHYRIPARGKDLYEYVAKQRGQTRTEADARSEMFEQLASFRDYDKYYFTCRGGQIDALNACQSGNVFREHTCMGIGPCIDVPVDEKRHLPDPQEGRYYLECDGPKLRDRKACPGQQIFHIDSCREVQELDRKCEDDPNFFLRIDDRRYIQCEGNKTVMKTCRYDEMLVGQKCESNACQGLLDGTKIALPEDSVTHAPFIYSPGYRVCQNGRVGEPVFCRDDWDRFQTEGADVTVLPRVFDNRDCVPPILCENTFLHDNVQIPRYHFQKHVREWRKAGLFDATVGYSCEGKGVKRIMNAPAGQLVKKFKFEPACDYLELVPVADEISKAYYNCTTQTKEKCPNDHYFDGTECKKSNANAFSFEGIDMFRLDGLDEMDGWIKPWSYSKDPSPFTTPAKPPCEEPESLYLHGYNVCSHPDCKPFAFLSLFKEGTMILPDGHFCHANRQGDLIKSKHPMVKSGFDFWNQRGEPNYDDPNALAQVSPDALSNCVPGTKIQSGIFVQDSTVYRTCDSKQPFVFCPSALTSGLKKIGEGKWACQPPKYFYLEAGQERTFPKNQLQRVHFIHPNTKISINGDKFIKLNDNYFDAKGEEVTIQCSAKVQLYYINYVTFPPNACLDIRKNYKFFGEPMNYFPPSSTINAPQSTNRALTFAQYKTIPLASQFLSDK